MSELISIITPLYNSSGFIEKTLNAVIQETYTNWELILIDDCSADNSIEIVEKFKELDPRIVLIKLPQNSGAAVARNTGIEAAKGRYIAFIDSDDIWFPEKLEKQIAFMQEENAPVSFTAYERINETDEVISGKIEVPETVDYNKLLLSNVIGCSTAIYDTKKCGKVYMPDIRKRQDHGLWLKILKQGHIAYGLNEILVQYRITSNSISSNKLDAAKWSWKLYREVEHLSIWKSLYCFTHYALKGTIKFLK